MRKLIHYLVQHSYHFLIVLVILILNRVIEYVYWIFIEGKDWSILSCFITSISFDALWMVLVAGIFSLPLSILSLSFPKMSSLLCKLICVLIVILNAGLFYFFITNNVLINITSIPFSWTEIKHIVLPELSLMRCAQSLVPVGFILGCIYLFFYKIKEIQVNPLTKTVILLTYLIALFVWKNNHTSFAPKYSKLRSSFEYHLCFNKILYSVHGYMKNIRDEESYILSEKDPSLDSYIREFQEALSYFKFETNAYPLLHKEDTSNTLGEFISHSKTKPNIVIIICESLSRSISGPGAGYGSYTPFLDSLARQGLYWEQFLSNSPSTEGVLPSILASLPPGTKKKMLWQAADSPDLRFLSLPSILKANGYRSTLYYPAWIGFCRMDNFIHMCGVDKIISDVDFDSFKYRRHHSTEKLSWGYTDRSLFSQYIDHKKKYSPDISTPSLDIFLTISMHTPFDDYLRDENINRLNAYAKTYGLTQHVLFQSPGNKHIAYSSLYFDMVLRDFFASMSQLSNFSNTIFIITGDHNLKSLPSRHELDPYHVPLIIWSPLLTRSKSMKAVGSHIDLTPSLLSLLKGNFGLKTPSQNHFIGSQLDTQAHFQSTKIFPLYLYSEAYPNFVYKNFLKMPGGIMQMNDQFGTRRVDHAAIEIQINRCYESYCVMDYFSTKQNRFLPAESQHIKWK